MKYPQALLLILDGWGESSQINGNAVRGAKAPVINRIAQSCPPIYLETSGEKVGLPYGQMGNSEVGHLNLGAGRIVDQDILRINKAISDSSFFLNPAFSKIADFAKNNNGAVHLLGLLSDGGVHSILEHLFALLEWAKRQKLEKIYLHLFLDGRDTPPKSALKYLSTAEQVLKEKSIGQIATIGGRYYAMDRDKRWERLWAAYKAMVFGEGLIAASAKEAIVKGYERGETDEFILPTIVASQDDGRIKDGDGIIFFNFRSDRGRQLTRALADPAFDGFVSYEVKTPRIAMATMTEYEAALPVEVAFPAKYIVNSLGEWFSKCNLKQLRIAETEKYAHVTYFFNGGQEAPFPGEDRILIPSPKAATYDLVPDMSSAEITDELEKNILSNQYQLIVVNYANLDMVGHTGNYEAAVAAMEAVDKCVGRSLAAVEKVGGIAILTSDHGNAEQMIDIETGQPHTSHTTNVVPCYFIVPKPDKFHFNPPPIGPFQDLRHGILADVAPALLDLLGMDKPQEMTERKV